MHYLAQCTLYGRYSLLDYTNHLSLFAHMTFGGGRNPSFSLYCVVSDVPVCHHKPLAPSMSRL